MKISQLYVYPVKSLRGVSLNEAQATRNGFDFDRTFMLLKREEHDGKPHRNMHLAGFPEMMLFTTGIELPKDGAASGTLTITYTDTTTEKPASISAPLRPQHDGLALIDVEMHGASCQAYRMGQKYDDWFSANFGFDVMFVYLGPSWRPVLMSTDNDTPRVRGGPVKKPSSWLSSISSISSYVGLGAQQQQQEDEKITFADCAPYLVCSEASCEQVSTRLEGEAMQIVKFRPNIVVAGADAPWVEDYWAEIAIKAQGSGSASEEDAVHISLPQNCGRCASINIDYMTGKPGTTSSGEVLKRMQKDRRVDVGMKYSPIFGRYGFASRNAGRTIRVGDEVDIVRQNTEHTKFDWPSLSTLRD